MHFIVVILIVVLAGAGLSSWWFSADQRGKRAMKAVPRLSVGDVSEGQRARITGRAELLDTLTAPLSGRACAAWRVVVRERRGSGKSSSWVTVLDESESVDFLVLDGSMKALVKTNDALVLLDKDSKDNTGVFGTAGAKFEAFLDERGLTSQGRFLSKHMQYSEGALEPGESVAVVGVGCWERDPDESARAGGGYRDATAPQRLVMTSSADDVLLLSDEPRMLT